MTNIGDAEQTNLPAEMGKNLPSVKKKSKPNQIDPIQTKKPKSNTPQKHRAKHMEQFWKSPFAELQNQKVLHRYMIM